MEYIWICNSTYNGRYNVVMRNRKQIWSMSMRRKKQVNSIVGNSIDKFEYYGLNEDVKAKVDWLSPSPY